MRVLLVVTASVVAGKRRVMKLDDAMLPNLTEFLTTVGLTEEHITKMQGRGLDRTRQLVRFGQSDVDLLSTELNISREVGAKLLEGISSLKKSVGGTTEDDRGADKLAALKEERSTLTYGRLYVTRSTTTFDYKRAWFGPAPPEGSLPVIRAVPGDACRRLVGFYEGAIVLADRGRCRFVDKAWHAHFSGAAALVVVNTPGSAFERPASGYATDAKETPTPPLPVALVDATANKALVSPATAFLVKQSLERRRRRRSWWTTFRHRLSLLRLGGLDERDIIHARFVPVKCRPGRPTCDALLPEELELPRPADSGYLRNTSYEFVTGAWASVLPAKALPVIRAPSDLCGPPPTWLCRRLGLVCGSVDYKRFLASAPGAAVLVDRGHCNFTTKATHIARVGGALMVVVDRTGHPLMQMGARGPPPSIPGILVDATTGTNIGPHIHLDIAHPGFASEWLDLLNVPLGWPDADSDALNLLATLERRHTSSPARLAWIRHSFHHDRLRFPDDDDDDDVDDDGDHHHASTNTCHDDGSNDTSASSCKKKRP